MKKIVGEQLFGFKEQRIMEVFQRFDPNNTDQIKKSDFLQACNALILSQDDEYLEDWYIIQRNGNSWKFGGRVKK